MDSGDMPPPDPWHLTDHHFLPMDHLLFNALEVQPGNRRLGVASEAQYLVNTLLVRTISLVVESRALSVDVARLVDTWHKRYWNVFMDRLCR